MSNDLFEGIVSIFGSKAISLVVGFLLTPILARILGSNLYGDYAFLMSMLGLGIIFVNAGTFDGLRKYVSTNKSDEWNAEILSFYVMVNVGLAAALGVGLAILLVTGSLRRQFGSVFETYFLLLTGLIVSRQFFSIARGTLMGFRVERYSESLHILRRVLFAVMGVVLAVIGLNVTGVLLGDLIATMAIAIIGFSLIFNRVDLSNPLRFDYARISATELLGFNSLNVVLILLTASLYHTDIILLHLFKGGQSTGFYKAALTVAEFLWLIPTVLQMALLQSTSELWDRGEAAQITELASRITRYNYLFTQLLAIGIAVLATPFVGLYFGTEFLRAAAVVPVLVIGALAFAISRPIFSIGQSKGALTPLIAATGAAATVNFVLNLLLIPRFGLNGAAVATATGYGLMVVFHTIAARRIGFDPIQDLRLARGLAVGVGTAVPLVWVARQLSEPWLQLVVIPPLGFAIYLGLALTTGAVRQDELLELRNSLPI